MKSHRWRCLKFTETPSGHSFRCARFRWHFGSHYSPWEPDPTLTIPWLEMFRLKWRKYEKPIIQHEGSAFGELWEE